MTAGVFNPFAPPEKKKKNFHSAMDNERPRDTEYEDSGPKSIIRLDGDSYVLQFEDIVFEDLLWRLYALLQAVHKQYAAQLLENGIQVLDQPPKHMAPTDLHLETPGGSIVVHAPNGKEVDCFRRIAYTLYILPIRDLLAKHKAKVYKRG